MYLYDACVCKCQTWWWIRYHGNLRSKSTQQLYASDVNNGVIRPVIACRRLTSAAASYWLLSHWWRYSAKSFLCLWKIVQFITFAERGNFSVHQIYGLGSEPIEGRHRGVWALPASMVIPLTDSFMTCSHWHPQTWMSVWRNGFVQHNVIAESSEIWDRWSSVITAGGACVLVCRLL